MMTPRKSPDALTIQDRLEDITLEDLSDACAELEAEIDDADVFFGIEKEYQEVEDAMAAVFSMTPRELCTMVAGNEGLKRMFLERARAGNKHEEPHPFPVLVRVGAGWRP